MAEALATNLCLGHFDAALVANDAAMLHALILAAETFPVSHGTKNTRAKKSITLRLEGAIVNRLGFVTSPCDHCRIFSGEASEMRIASKSGANCCFSCWNRNMSLHCQLPIANFRLILAPVTLTPIPFPVRQPKRQSALALAIENVLRLYRTGNQRFANALFRWTPIACRLAIN